MAMYCSFSAAAVTALSLLRREAALATVAGPLDAQPSGHMSSTFEPVCESTASAGFRGSFWTSAGILVVAGADFTEAGFEAVVPSLLALAAACCSAPRSFCALAGLLMCLISYAVLEKRPFFSSISLSMAALLL